MNLYRYLVLALAAAGCLVVAAAEVEIDARGGEIYSQQDADFVIGSNAGSGDGIVLVPSQTVKIRSLKHTKVVCDAVVKLAGGQLLQFSSLAVSNAVSMTFFGIDSAGVGSADEDYGNLFLDVAPESSVNLYAPMGATTLHMLGGGSVVAREPFVATVTNDAGTIYFGTGESGLVGLRSDAAFVYRADCNAIRASEVEVDSQKNGGVGVRASVVSLLDGDKAEINDFIVGGGNDVEIAAGLMLYNSDFVNDPGAFAADLPDCAVIGSNSVGVLRVNGSLATKLAIADGELEKAKGAVYVGSGASVTNFSAVAGEPLLGRSGYACLDVAGDYVAYGGWFGAIDGQLSLNVTGSFRHPAAAVRASRFLVGGSDALAAITVDRGVFDAAEAAFDVNLPWDDGADGVFLTVENEGLFDLGTNVLSIASETAVSVNGGGTLAAAAVDVSSPAVLQLDGGYLRANGGGKVFSGRAYGHSRGFGFDVPTNLTAQVDSDCLPLPPTGDGISSIALGSAVAGRKFIGPPIVVISDTGSGHGAAAVAELQDGAVSAIRVTGRGSGYVNPSAKLVYGAEVISLGAVTTTENAAGPLLKRGEGTLSVDAVTQMVGLEIYGGTLRTTVANAVLPGPLYIAAGATYDAYFTEPRFTFYSGAGSIVNGPIYLSGLVVDMDRAKVGDVDTLALGEVRLEAGAGIRLLNFAGLDRYLGRYVIYRLTGELPETLPVIEEATYATGLSRGWHVKIEGNELVLRYVGGSIFMFY